MAARAVPVWLPLVCLLYLPVASSFPRLPGDDSANEGIAKPVGMGQLSSIRPGIVAPRPVASAVAKYAAPGGLHAPLSSTSSGSTGKIVNQRMSHKFVAPAPISSERRIPSARKLVAPAPISGKRRVPKRFVAPGSAPQ